MKISIVIPVYNTADKVEHCVRSITNGAGNYDYEIILVDDGSIDESWEVCQILAKKNDYVYAIHQSNSGAAAARNRGIKFAHGDYITFVDSDDYVNENYLKAIYGYIESTDVDILWFNMKAIDEANNELFQTDLPNKKKLRSNDFLCCFYGMNLGIGSMCSKVYRRSFIEAANILVDEQRVYGEDWDFNLRLAQKSPVVLVVSDVLYNYIKYGSVATVSTRYNSADFDVYCESHQRLVEIGDKYGISYDRIDNSNLFVYNVISLLIKLYMSPHDDVFKEKEYQRIIHDYTFVDFLKESSYFNHYMSKRQTIAAALIRLKMPYFAKVVLCL